MATKQKRGPEDMRRHRAKKREAKLKADSELLVSFVKAFPGQTTVNISDIEHEDYQNPVRGAD